MWLEVAFPDGLDGPGIASLHMGCAAIGDKRNAGISILWWMPPAPQHASVYFLLVVVDWFVAWHSG